MWIVTLVASVTLVKSVVYLENMVFWVLLYLLSGSYFVGNLSGLLSDLFLDAWMCMYVYMVGMVFKFVFGVSSFLQATCSYVLFGLFFFLLWSSSQLGMAPLWNQVCICVGAMTLSFHFSTLFIIFPPLELVIFGWWFIVNNLLVISQKYLTACLLKSTEQL